MNVLIIDDDEDICMILQLIFGKKGWQSKYCLSGASGVDEAKKANYDVIFLDILMPEMDGVAVLKALRAAPKTAQTPVIFLTAKEVSQTERADLIGMGAQGIYLKPVDPMTVIEGATQFMKK